MLAFTLGPGSSRVSGGAVVPALPASASANYKVDFDPDAIAVQGDNTDIAAFTDKIGGVTFSGGVGPKYRTAVGSPWNAKAYIRFNAAVGTSGMTCVTGSQGALKTLMDSQEYTMFMVVGNVGTAANGTILGSTLSSSGDLRPHWSSNDASGNKLIGHLTGTTSTRGSIPVTGAGYFAYAVGSSKTFSPVGSGSGGMTRNYLRGIPFCTASSRGPKSEGGTWGMGATGSGTGNRGTFDLLRIIAYDRLLTQAEILEVEAYLNYQFNQTHPVVTAGKLTIIDGDSRSTGVGTDTAAGNGSIGFAYQQHVATGLGLTPGSWACFAFPGYTIADNITRGPLDVDPLRTYFTEPARIIYEEFQNSRALLAGDISAPGTLAYQTKQYFDARKAAFGVSAKMLAISPCDSADTSVPSPLNWGNWMGAGNGGGGSNNWALLGVDGLADVWANATLGGILACPNIAPFTPWSDGIHLLGNGTSSLATDGQYIQAQIVLTAIAGVSGW